MKAVLVLWAAALGALLYRLGFGVDLNDEAWYVTMAYRFAMGDRPYVDEIYLMQGASMLYSPLVAAFVSWKGSTEGILLFTRGLYFLWVTAIAYFVARSLRPLSSREGAMLAGLGYAAFLPFGLPGLGYNTVGIGLTTLGIALSLDELTSRWRLVFAGVVLGMAPIAHPTSALAVLIFLGLRRRWEPVLGLGLVAFAFLLWIGFPAWREQAIATKALNAAYGNGADLKKLLFVFSTGYRTLLVATLAGLCALAFARKFPKGLLALPLVLYLANRSAWGGFGPSGYVLCFAWIAPFLWLRTREKELTYYFLPWFFGGLAMAVTSFNGLPNWGIALIPGTVVTLVLVARELPRAYFLAFAGAHLSVLVYCQFTQIYQEDRLSQLTQRVASGPFLGLKTTPEKVRYLERLQTAIEPYRVGKGLIAFFPHFPAGYLMTTRRPGQKTTWGCLPGEPEKTCALTPDVNPAIFVKRVFYQRDKIEPMPRLLLLEQNARARLKLKVDEADFTVFAAP